MRPWCGGRLSEAARLAAVILASWGTAAAQDFAGREKLRAHGEQEFRKDVTKVTDGVYVAVGYSMANAILIVGDGGSIIVDTTTKLDDAQAVRAEFAKISRAPVRAIIYTHSHPDHTGGASVFAGTDRPEIYSHQLFVDRVPDSAVRAATAATSLARRCPTRSTSTAVPAPSSGVRRARPQ
jgi:uncharacterized sulfatase